MQYGKEQYIHDELADLVENWNKISLDFKYENHPDEITLDRYVHGALLPTADPVFSDAQDIEAWLDGQHGWSASSVSLHVMSCSDCRSQVSALREIFEADHVHQNVGWWKQVQEDPRRIWSLGTLRRSAIALAFVVILVGGLFVVDDTIINVISDRNSDVIESNGGGASMPESNSDAAVARLF